MRAIRVRWLSRIVINRLVYSPRRIDFDIGSEQHGTSAYVVSRFVSKTTLCDSRGRFGGTFLGPIALCFPLFCSWGSNIRSQPTSENLRDAII